MLGRDVQGPIAPVPELMLEAPRHWTAGLFLLGLGGLHVFIGAPAVLSARWEGTLSVALGALFLFAAILCLITTRRIILAPQQRVLKLRTGCGRLAWERQIAFEDICAVRLTFSSGRTPMSSSTLEVLCERDTIPCPRSCIPRQQALFMAMAMNVRLIKVYATEVPPTADRLHQLAGRDDDADDGDQLS